MVVLDEKIANVFYRMILVDGLILALVGLVMSEPIPTIFGFGFIVLGMFTMILCMHKISKSADIARALGGRQMSYGRGGG